MGERQLDGRAHVAVAACLRQIARVAGYDLDDAALAAEVATVGRRAGSRLVGRYKAQLVAATERVCEESARKRAAGKYVGRPGAYDLCLALSAERQEDTAPPCSRRCHSGMLTAVEPDGTAYAILCDCARGERLRQAGHPLAGSSMPDDVLARGGRCV